MQRKVYKFISQQNNNPIIKRKTCRLSGKDFPIFMTEQQFLQKISPTFDEKHFRIPTPTLAPEIRHMRRMLFRNDRSLYSRKCDGTGKNIICMYAPDKPYKVYDRDYWRSDERSAFDYGFDFDFNKTFNEQFDQLLKTVPMSGVLNSNSHNSTYVNQTGNMKDSYLMFSCMDSENCLYGSRLFDSKYCVDCAVLYDSENCYECIDGHNLYQCFWCRNVNDSSDCYFCFDCINCKHCIGCYNLRNAQYCIDNQQYTKEEYQKKSQVFLDQIGSQSALATLKQQFQNTIKNKAVFRDMYLDNCERTFGGYLYNSKDTIDCYEGGDLEHCMHGLMIHNAEHVHDGNNTTGAQRQYEVSTGGINGYNSMFSLDIRPENSHVLYCAYTPHCSNCFGCVGLKQQSYFVFNKAYSKLEYEQLVARIIVHMHETRERGEFFDPSISPFGYNESAAFEYYPLDKQKAALRGFPWYDKEIKTGKSDASLPDRIEDIDENILNTVLYCKETNRPFKLTKQEFQFYKKYGIAIPQLHPDVRHQKRFDTKPERTLHLRTCSTCGIETTSVYPQSYKGKVYCNECYVKEVY